MSVAVHNYITGKSSVEIARSIEAAIRDARLGPDEPLPTVRATAHALRVSPATVAAAYKTLRERGVLVTRGRRGTAVSARPPLPARPGAPLPPGVVNLADGNPDPTQLPELRPALARIDTPQRLYGEEIGYAPLLRRAAEQFHADGVPAEHLTVVSGAMDGLERVLAVHLRRGDRVVIEDPGFSAVIDLLHVLGLEPVPVPLDDAGLLPAELAQALARNVAALILTPRAQNPSGAALDPARVRALRRVLRDYPELLVIEDDHAGPVAGAPAATLCSSGRARWAVIRSVSKSLGPDLRVALVSGDATTIGRVEGRTLIGMRWVSHVLQRLVVSLWSQTGMKRSLLRAERTYEERRTALIDALAAHGIAAHGRSGLNVWIPVSEEAPVVSGLLDAGWAVSAGERFRLTSPPAIRVSIGQLDPKDARLFASDLASLLSPAPRTSTS